MAVHRPPTKLDKLASRQPNFRPDAPSPPPDSVPAFLPTARRLPLHRAEVTDVFYTLTVPRPNSPAIIVKSNTPDSSRLSRRGTQTLLRKVSRRVILKRWYDTGGHAVFFGVHTFEWVGCQEGQSPHGGGGYAPLFCCAKSNLKGTLLLLAPT
jgi:hypothetical protein